MSAPTARRRRPPSWRPSSSTPRSAPWSSATRWRPRPASGGAGTAELVHAHDGDERSSSPASAAVTWRRAELGRRPPGPACSSRVCDAPFSADERNLLHGHGAHPRARAARRRGPGDRAHAGRRARAPGARAPGTARLAARAPSPARGPARHPALDLAPQAAVRGARGDHRRRQRTARRLPGRARARRSARPRAPDRRRRPPPAASARNPSSPSSPPRRRRCGTATSTEAALAASVHINGARAGALVAMAPSAPPSTTPSSACSTPSPSTRASRSPTRAPSRRWRRPSTTR